MYSRSLIYTGSGRVGGAWGHDYGRAEKDRADWVLAAPPLKDDRSNVNASRSHLQTCKRQPTVGYLKQEPSSPAWVNVTNIKKHCQFM